MTTYVPLEVMTDWRGALAELDNGSTFALHLEEARLGDDALTLTYEGRTHVKGTLVAVYTLPSSPLRARHEAKPVLLDVGDGMSAQLGLHFDNIDWRTA